jgi:hypothetical protein
MSAYQLPGKFHQRSILDQTAKAQVIGPALG